MRDTDRIRAAVDYVELLRESGVTVHGNRGLCPFYDSPRPDRERKPGFVILDGRVGYGHGCGWKGDVFSFVQRRDGVDFASALRILADRVGIEIQDKGEVVFDSGVYAAATARGRDGIAGGFPAETREC